MGIGAPTGDRTGRRIAPRLVLPDGRAGLQGVDGVASRLERFGPVRRTDDDDDRAVSQLELTETVQESDATGVRPPHAYLVGDLMERCDDLFLVRLVHEVLHIGAHLPTVVDGMVAHRAAEQHDGSATGQHGPLVRHCDGKLALADRRPHVASVRRLDGSRHLSSVAGGTPRSPGAMPAGCSISLP